MKSGSDLSLAIENKVLAAALTGWNVSIPDATITAINLEAKRLSLKTLTGTDAYTRANFTLFLKNTFPDLHTQIDADVDKIANNLLAANTLASLQLDSLRPKDNENIEELKKIFQQADGTTPTVFLIAAVLAAEKRITQPPPSSSEKVYADLATYITALTQPIAARTGAKKVFINILSSSLGIDASLFSADDKKIFNQLVSKAFFENQINGKIFQLTKVLTTAYNEATKSQGWFGGSVPLPEADKFKSDMLALINSLRGMQETFEAKAALLPAGQRAAFLTPQNTNQMFITGLDAISQSLTTFTEHDMAGANSAYQAAIKILGDPQIAAANSRVLQAKQDEIARVANEDIIIKSMVMAIETKYNTINDQLRVAITEEEKNQGIADFNELKTHIDEVVKTIADQFLEISNQKLFNQLGIIKSRINSNDIVYAIKTERAAPPGSILKILESQLNSVEIAKKQAGFESLLEIVGAGKRSDIQPKLAFIKNIQTKIPKLALQNFITRLEAAATRFNSGEDAVELEQAKEEFKTVFKEVYKKLGEKAATVLETHPIDDADANASISWSKIIIDALRSPPGKAGNLAIAVIAQKTKDNAPKLMELRDTFEANNLGITQGLYASGKSGGANLPGAFGGNYLLPYQTADGRIHVHTVFFKQPTEKDKSITHQEGIAEVYGGRVMNVIDPDHSAPTFCTVVPGGTLGQPQDVYVGSVFHRDFQDLFHASYEVLKRDDVPPRSGTRAQNIWERYIGDKQKVVNEGLEKIFGTGKDKKAVYTDQEHKDQELSAVDAARLRESFGKASMSALLFHLQIHSENMGIANVNGNLEVVSLDYGAAGRTDYETSVQATKFKMKSVPVQHGRFPRNIDPLKPAGKKYGLAYFGTYPESLRYSKEAIAGYDAIANSSRSDLAKAVRDTIAYNIEYYGVATFAKEFAAKLDTSIPPAIADLDSTDPVKLKTAVEVFLVDAQLARQLSIREFSLKSKIIVNQKSATGKTDFPTNELDSENPVYSLRKMKKSPQNEADFVSDFITPTTKERNDIRVVLAKDFAVMQYKMLDSESLKNLATCLMLRLQGTAALLSAIDSPDDDQKKLLADVEELYKFLNNALTIPNFYDLSNKPDQKIIAQACDAAYCMLTEVYETMPAQKADFLELQTDLSAADSTSAAQYIAGMGDIIRGYDFNVPIDADDLDVDGGLEDAGPVYGPEPDSNPNPNPNPLNNVPIAPPAPPNLYNNPATLFGKRLINANILQTFVNYIDTVSQYFEADNAARQSLNNFANSRFGVQAIKFADSLVADEAKELNQKQKQTVQNLKIKVEQLKKELKEPISFLPSNVVRSESMPVTDFATKYNNNVSQFTTWFETSGNKVADKTRSLQNDYVAVNYIVNKPVAPAAVAGVVPSAPVVPPLKDAACYLEGRFDNTYSIRLMRLPINLSRSVIIDQTLAGQGIDKAQVDLVKALWKKYEREDSQLTPPGATPIDAITTALGGNRTLADAMINKILSVTTQTVPGGASGVTKTIPSDTYLAVVDSQIQRFLANAGSDRIVRIKPTPDPLLAEAYVIMCAAHGLECRNASGYHFYETGVPPKISVPVEILDHIAPKMDGKILSKPLPVGKELRDFVNNLYDAIKNNPKLDAAVKNEMKAFHDDLLAGKSVPSADIYKVADKISQQLDAPLRTPTPTPPP